MTTSLRSLGFFVLMILVGWNALRFDLDRYAAIPIGEFSNADWIEMVVVTKSSPRLVKHPDLQSFLDLHPGSTLLLPQQGLDAVRRELQKEGGWPLVLRLVEDDGDKQLIEVGRDGDYPRVAGYHATSTKAVPKYTRKFQHDKRLESAFVQVLVVFLLGLIVETYFRRRQLMPKATPSSHHK